MKEILKKTKRELFNLILRQADPFRHETDEKRLIDFLSRIWDLESMTSQDLRYDNALGDIYQHTVNNDDWTIEYLFLERLELFKEDDVFIKFVETVISPTFRHTEDEIDKYLLLITPLLEKEGLTLFIDEYDDEDLPVYKIALRGDSDKTPVGIKKNDIPFFVEKAPSGKPWFRSSHKTPKQFPSFQLVFNDGWNDYSLMTSFYLYYYETATDCFEFGETKIMHEDGHIIDKIPEHFTDLNGDFCSLGQNYSYYRDLKDKFNREFDGILFAIKDAAFFPDIHERFEKHRHFLNSLIRYDEVERLLREAKYQLNDYDLSNLYKFKFNFNPNFSSTPIDIDFEFNNEGKFPNRIYAIIGKNGTGKTQFITSLPLKIAKKEIESFTPRIPLFSKVIAVSYSVFDHFEIPRKTASFNYLYCGLRNEQGEIMSEKGLALRFHSTWKKIKSLERMEEWREILLNFIEQELVDEFVKENSGEYTVSIDGFNQVKNKLSSGQSIILYIITEIVANIRLDSLLLFDEPETHLHPNAISQLINTIYDLIGRFESYCIITTHSPLIVQEILSKSVYVIERIDDTASIRRIGLESFGENLTTLTEEVFGNKEIPKQYKMIIDELIREGNSFEEVLSVLEHDGLPLSLNARAYIKAIIGEGNEESRLL